MPSVYFLCNSNRGKSQMAEALARKHAPEWETYSAGVKVTKSGAEGEVNQESVEALAEVGADMTHGRAEAVDPQLLRSVDHVVIVGGAELDWPEDATGKLERWEVSDPSIRTSTAWNACGLSATRLTRTCAGSWGSNLAI